MFDQRVATDPPRICTQPLQRISTINKDFKKLLERGRFTLAKSLFDQLPVPGSWWHPMLQAWFRHSLRLTHYTDMFMFQGVQCDSDELTRVKAFIRDPASSGPGVDFFQILQDSLCKFCEWLDELETILVNTLSTNQTGSQGTIWSPPAICPRLFVPVGMQAGTREIPENFLYMPVCDGSLPIKGTSTLIVHNTEEANQSVHGF